MTRRSAIVLEFAFCGKQRRDHCVVADAEPAHRAHLVEPLIDSNSGESTAQSFLGQARHGDGSPSLQVTFAMGSGRAV